MKSAFFTALESSSHVRSEMLAVLTSIANSYISKKNQTEIIEQLLVPGSQVAVVSAVVSTIKAVVQTFIASLDVEDCPEDINQCTSSSLSQSALSRRENSVKPSSWYESYQVGGNRLYQKWLHRTWTRDLLHIRSRWYWRPEYRYSFQQHSFNGRLPPVIQL